MSRQLLVGTRKGLHTYEYDNGKWCFVRENFRGVPVSFATADPRHGTLWACLDHGHWGTKLHRSTDEGRSWEEIPAPRYPLDSLRPDGQPAATSYLWIVQPGGNDQPQRLYIGTEPGGLFQSDDGGDSFQLVESLWQHSSRENWFGGGRDHPGLCSICVDPRDSNHLMAGISVFQGRYNNQIPLTMAGMVIASAPMLILYILFQKYFIRGLMAGAVK